MATTIRVPAADIHALVIRRLATLVSEQQARELATIITDAELDGVHTHGLKRLERLIGELKAGDIHAQGQLQRSTSLGAWEVWDGGAAPGPLNALACTRRAVQLAQQQGIGCVSLHNTNHWLRPGYYGKQAAAQGCALLCWSNTLPNVVPHGGTVASIGNNPLTIALPTKPVPFVLDMAMSQFSYGKMQAYSERGESLPLEGGYNAEGKPTRDPTVIQQNLSASAIGLWKGTGLSMALDLLAALLSTGQSTHEIGRHDGECNISQVFIALDLERLYGPEQLAARTQELLEQLLRINPGCRWPGQGMAQRRQQQEQQGVEIESAFWCSLQ
ncbi:MAG TPA: Ldh family oxidoreductase [Cellvibrionaceae bacterium]